jgi:cysteinyl-tRNA synthetase
LFKLYNTLTQKIEPFEVQESNNVRMYSCGPSTYQPAHIGNYRTFLFEDVLHRYLEYLGFNVTSTITMTDVEEKAIQQAKKENITVEEVTSKNEAVFFNDSEILRIKKPDFSIRASRSVDQPVKLICTLLQKGYAYIYNYKGERNIYFDPLKFKGFGKLAHLDMKKWPKKRRRFHKDTYPGTPWNMGDFVIWHGCHQRQPFYETVFGSGRPAWNIQDAAIITKTLGFHIDVACGGIDNLVRHHDYTLAIIEAISEKPFCRFWLHGAHLFVDGEKMSKSKGKVYYLCDLVDKGFSGAQIRYCLIYGNYRKTLNFTMKKIVEDSQRLESLRKKVRDLVKMEATANISGKEAYVGEIVVNFEKNMNDDLNVKAAFDYIYESIKEIHKKRLSFGREELKNVLGELRRCDYVFQCIF